jgi:cell division septation protein DedD
MPDLKKPESREAYPKHPYSIQLGSFRTIVQAKNAVTTFRGKGLSAYWSEVDRGDNERWFRVYTGSFETRDEAKKYRHKK